MSHHRETPTVGYAAWHKEGLDPREVVEVSEDQKAIKIRIGTVVTDWLPAENYTYVEHARNPDVGAAE